MHLPQVVLAYQYRVYHPACNPSQEDSPAHRFRPSGMVLHLTVNDPAKVCWWTFSSETCLIILYKLSTSCTNLALAATSSEQQINVKSSPFSCIIQLGSPIPAVNFSSPGLPPHSGEQMVVGTPRDPGERPVFLFGRGGNNNLLCFLAWAVMVTVTKAW